jgi:hypothetical protein
MVSTACTGPKKNWCSSTYIVRCRNRGSHHGIHLIYWPYNSSQMPHGENCAMQNLQLNQQMHDDPDGHSSSLIQPVGVVASARYGALGVASWVASRANSGTSTPSRRNDIDIESSRFLFMPPPLLKFALMLPSALSWIDVDCTTIFSLRTRSVTLAGCADDTAKSERRQTNDLSILLSWWMWYAVSKENFQGRIKVACEWCFGGLGAVLSKVVGIGDRRHHHFFLRSSRSLSSRCACPSFQLLQAMKAEQIYLERMEHSVVQSTIYMGIKYTYFTWNRLREKVLAIR